MITESDQVARFEPAEASLDKRIGSLCAAHTGASGLEVLASNVSAFAARRMSAQRATRSLDLMYYVWGEDLTGRLLLSEVLAAADRGVKVRLLLDDIGVSSRDNLLKALNSHAQITVRLFNPVNAFSGSRRRLSEVARRLFSMTRRMHNKAWITDSLYAIMGGRNIGDAYFDADEMSNFRDLDLLAVGPVVDEAETMFDRYWKSELVTPMRPSNDGVKRWSVLSDLRSAGESPEAQSYLDRVLEETCGDFPDSANLHWSNQARLIADPPEKALGRHGENGLMGIVLPVLEAARQRIAITSPYFVPGKAGTDRLTGIANRGIKIRVLTNSLAATDVAAVHGGYAHYRMPLLQAGVDLYELRQVAPKRRLSFRGKSHASLHTKAFSVDGATGFIGSLNFDPRSTSLNTEMGVLFDAPDLVTSMDQLFADEIASDVSYAVRLDKQARLSWIGTEEHGPVIYHREPGASLIRRAIARIVGWLPLESQL
ncbi:MAG: phospholipase D family protein [bacterium]